MGIKLKIDPRNLLLVAISTMFSLGALEILLRIIFSTNQSYLMKESFDQSFLVENEFWKVWHYPNSKTTHKKDCFEVTYITNQWGMHDDAANLIKDSTKTRIVLLGDSFVEGFGVSQNENFSSLLDSIHSDRLEILNFGLSGGIGTVHELALYENLARHFNPDLVLLFYLNYNDLYDNNKAIDEGLVSKNLELTYHTSNLNEVLKAINEKTIPKTSNSIIQNSYCLSLAKKGARVFSSFLQTAINIKADFKRSLSDNYDPSESKNISNGYKIVTKSLQRLDSLVKLDSSKLVVIQLPDPYQVDKNWISYSAQKFDQKLDPIYPNKKIKGICDSLNIGYFDMYPRASRYIEENKLSFPYFSQTCDRHPSKFGHQYIATEVDRIIKSELEQ